ncbi:MAG: prephenate dehydrogenase [Clostridia bacterium]
MNCKHIAIVGLGLIGGSLLKALQGFEGAVFHGIDRDADVVRRACAEGLLAAEPQGEADILQLADVTIVCLPPVAAIDFMNRSVFKKDALVTDVCGVKQAIYAGLTNREIDFIGGHPMAGKETSGYAASDGNLFQNASYLITPDENSRPEHVAFLKDMAAYIGCRETVLTTPADHDRMIAYTSQLMHVVAVSLCDNPQLDDAKRFSAGSLRDCTRVARLDSGLWSQLFMLNKQALTTCVEEFENSLDRFKGYLASDDESGLRDFLEEATRRKLRFLA